ncbi:hypothetical protein [Streptococcus pneumoniae]|uniref:hypothetical protein n=1 Tax=Streptococcus pneumoniae TaxID=1313 RepID=UPI0005DCFCCC|nr:hypothetical protein [Streptococcus pneumoniae]CJE20815.1 Uncharacterised protein [Streptococcus pneumoniae]COQ56382.1 Uncharacterised protein [Streptococcus pneumoniae]
MNKEIIDDYETLIASMEVVIMALETVERFLVKEPSLDLDTYLDLRKDYTAVLVLAIDRLKQEEAEHTKIVKEYYHAHQGVDNGATNLRRINRV